MSARRRHRVVDVAAQSGLSRATVDRVLHGRPGVRPETVAQVERALSELDRQRDQVHLSGRTLLVDLVMQAPDRFARPCRDALEAGLRTLRPAVLRARSHLSEYSDPAAAARLLDAIGRRGSHGVVLKAPDHPLVREAVDRLAARGIPTVTFVTDVRHCRRVASVGMDNRSAGATAAYLVAQWAGPTGGVLLTVSHSSFTGEEERTDAFSTTLTEFAPRRRVHVVRDTDGLDTTIRDAAGRVLDEHRRIDTVYSVGGGNTGVLDALASRGRTPRAFIAHDLDDENRALLRTRRISAVLHHDLQADLLHACRSLLRAHRLLPGAPTDLRSRVQVVTPFNEPGSLSGDAR